MIACACGRAKYHSMLFDACWLCRRENRSSAPTRIRVAQPKNDALRTYILEHPDMSDTEIAKQVARTRERIRQLRKALGLPPSQHQGGRPYHGRTCSCGKRIYPHNQSGFCRACRTEDTRRRKMETALACISCGAKSTHRRATMIANGAKPESYHCRSCHLRLVARPASAAWFADYKSWRAQA